jgi:hypothetical protein
MRAETMELLKHPAVIAALITLVGAAVFVPLIKKFYFDPRSRLRVEVRAFRAKTSGGLKKIAGDSLDAKQQYFGPMRSLLGCDGYAVVTITNIGKKKIVGVTAMSPKFPLIWELDGADEPVELQQGQSFNVGDIQPKRSQVIHLWCVADMSEFSFGPMKKHLIRISADELDSASFRFPLPKYVYDKLATRIVPISWILFVFVFFLLLYTEVIK